MTLPTIPEVESWTQIAQSDPALKGALLHLLREGGLIDALGLAAMPEAPPSPPSHGPVPAAWDAFQIGVFDNGEQKGSRGRPKAVATRFAFDVKLWGQEPNFRHLPIWKAKVPFWSKSFAVGQIDKLLAADRITEDTASAASMLMDQTDDNWLVGIALQRKTGTYYSDLVCALEVIDGVPQSAILFSDAAAFRVESFVDRDAGNNKLIGLCVGMARIGRSDKLVHWATQELV